MLRRNPNSFEILQILFVNLNSWIQLKNLESGWIVEFIKVFFTQNDFALINFLKLQTNLVGLIGRKDIGIILYWFSVYRRMAGLSESFHSALTGCSSFISKWRLGSKRISVLLFALFVFCLLKLPMVWRTVWRTGRFSHGTRLRFWFVLKYIYVAIENFSMRR